MTAWPSWSIAFFAYVAFVAGLRVSATPRARAWSTVIAAIGGGLSVAAFRLPATHPLNVWVLPIVVLYLSYRATGLLFTTPMPRAERLLVGVDRALGIDRIAHRLPRWLAELLEFAYASIYTLMMLALILALWIGVSAARFWTLVLVTDYICFGMLPWIRTRTPRETIDPEPWRSSFRAINLRLVKAGSVGVNTFPSGHAAEALVAVLVVLGGPWWIVAGIVLAAAAVSAGTVFGRYHYALDIVAGWLVALVVWSLIPGP